MQPLVSTADLPWGPLLAAWPTAAFVLDRDGTVLAHGGGEAALHGWLPADARGGNFFVDVIPGDEVPELGGAFHAAMDDEEQPLDLSLSWHLETAERRVDVRLRLRKVEDSGQTLCIATIEDDTRLQTAESALAAAMGEAREQQHADPVTGLWGRRQFDFVLPVELRRGHRYGVGTTLMAIDARWDSTSCCATRMPKAPMARCAGSSWRRRTCPCLAFQPVSWCCAWRCRRPAPSSSPRTTCTSPRKCSRKSMPNWMRSRRLSPITREP